MDIIYNSNYSDFLSSFLLKFMTLIKKACKWSTNVSIHKFIAVVQQINVKILIGKITIFYFFLQWPNLFVPHTASVSYIILKSIIQILKCQPYTWISKHLSTESWELSFFKFWFTVFWCFFIRGNCYPVFQVF